MSMSAAEYELFEMRFQNDSARRRPNDPRPGDRVLVMVPELGWRTATVLKIWYHIAWYDLTLQVDCDKSIHTVLYNWAGMMPGRSVPEPVLYDKVVKSPVADHLRFLAFVKVKTHGSMIYKSESSWVPLPYGFTQDWADPTPVKSGHYETWSDPSGPVSHDAVLLWDTIRECCVVYAGKAAWNGLASPEQRDAAMVTSDELLAKLVKNYCGDVPLSALRYVLEQPRMGETVQVVSSRGLLDATPFPVGTEGVVIAIGDGVAVIKTSDGRVGVHDARNLRATTADEWCDKKAYQKPQEPIYYHVCKRFGIEFMDHGQLLPTMNGYLDQTEFLVGKGRPNSFTPMRLSR